MKNINEIIKLLQDELEFYGRCGMCGLDEYNEGVIYGIKLSLEIIKNEGH
jgi:hypothetical protein